MMSETPINIVISGLQTQISELKEIISGKLKLIINTIYLNISLLIFFPI
jgi:hypothetical protein